MTSNDKILTIYGSHDASATFVDKNGDLRIFELERMCDIRYAMYSSEFDRMSTKHFYTWGLGTGQSVRKNFLSLIKKQIKNDPEVIVYSNSTLNNQDLNLIKEYFPESELESFDGHHMSHAYCGYFQSPFKNALIVSVDGGGCDYGTLATTKVYIGFGNEIKEIFKSDFDFGLSYNYIGVPISEINPGKGCHDDLGAILSYAGKIMGLCAYGKVIPEWILPMENFYNHKDLLKLGEEIGLDLRLDSLSGQDSYNLAATSQNVFENILLNLILNFFKENKTNVVLTGGCALNVIFNQKLKEILNKEGFDLFVPPNPNDCGQSLGQYLFKTKKHIDPLVYGGVDILDRDDIDQYLNDGNYKSEEVSIKRIFDLITDGKIGGIVQGYSEVGPRALGNRSIICDPSFENMKEIINKKVKFREWFRPFAPVCREEDRNIYFDNAYISEYMSYAPLVKNEYKDKLPSITHADGTARLQTVNKNQNSLFYNILSYMDKNKKIPVILNTSFNIKGRPILTRIKDAFYVLNNTELDFLIIENLLIVK